MSKMKSVILSLIICGVILVVGMYIMNGESRGPKDTINLKSEIIKSEDEINTMQVGQSEKIQIKFTWEVDGIKYTDAIYLSREEYEQLSEKEIEEMKKQRFENWAKSVNAQSIK